MSALKSIVIVMSIAIAILMTMMAYGLYQKSQNPDFKFFNLSRSSKSSPDNIPSAPISGGNSAAQTPNLKVFGEISLGLPQGSTIVSAKPFGVQLTIVIATDGIHADQVWMVDLRTGKILGQIKVGR